MLIMMSLSWQLRLVTREAPSKSNRQDFRLHGKHASEEARFWWNGIHTRAAQGGHAPCNVPLTYSSKISEVKAYQCEIE